ncbi:MAG TPA: hypothetical protein VK937_00885 [Candidatus Limnocylindria bacterium]|nr:hypothetical protein [Candidatus Limnocylindria bacterium]
MNSLLSFLAGILSTALLAPSGAGFPQGQNNQSALAKQSSIIFSGTVSQLGAVSFVGVPQSPQTIVVRVDSVLKKPPAVSLKKGDNITVEVKDPSAFQQGAQATFYAEGWIFGSGVAVKELGHDFNPGGGAPAEGARTAETALGQVQEQISDGDLQNRIASSDLVVIGRITDVHRWTIPKSAAARYPISEHSADWHEAVLQIKSILKGTKPKGGKMAVRFPLSRDVAWVNSPKFQKQQQGIFFLKRDQVSGDPTATLGGYQVAAYTCLEPGDWLPLSDEARVRSLLKK